MIPGRRRTVSTTPEASFEHQYELTIGPKRASKAASKRR
jgi:hypothetical protein